MMSRRIQPWRWLVKVLQALLILGIPFLVVHGESALRFDVPSLTLHFFGTKIGMDEFFLVLVTVLFLGFLLALLTILFGRIWCGWLCPQTVLIDLTRFLDRPAAGGRARRLVALGSVLLVSVVVAASILWYFVSPYEFIARLRTGTLGQFLGWSWTILTVLTFLNFAFLRHRFCTTVCPYAKMQGALYDDRTLIIGADLDRMDACMHCDACVTVCPVQIDVRKGLNAACINCAECIDTCSRQMGRRGMRSLIGYRFGIHTAERTPFRRGVILAFLATSLFLAMLFHGIAGRLPLDLSVSADPSSPPRRSTDSAVINTYVLSLTNRTEMAMTVGLSARIGGAPANVRPERVEVPPERHIRATIAIIAQKERLPEETARTVLIVVEPLSRSSGRIGVEAAFQSPW